MRAGTDPLDQPTILAGTPATVARGGTSCRTTLPAPTLASRPISTLSSTFAPAHSSTPSRTFGCRSPRSLLEKVCRPDCPVLTPSRREPHLGQAHVACIAGIDQILGELEADIAGMPKNPDTKFDLSRRATRSTPSKKPGSNNTIYRASFWSKSKQINGNRHFEAVEKSRLCGLHRGFLASITLVIIKPLNSTVNVSLRNCASGGASRPRSRPSLRWLIFGIGG